MADFRVAYQNGVVVGYSGDGASYVVNNQTGVLRVHDGKGSRFHFSPTGWLSVEDEDEEKPVAAPQGTR
jgi:hypothetical protein